MSSEKIRLECLRLAQEAEITENRTYIDTGATARRARAYADFVLGARQPTRQARGTRTPNPNPVGKEPEAVA